MVVYGAYELFQWRADRFVKFYRYQVWLTHKPSGEEIHMEIPVGCRIRQRHILGEGRSSRYVRSPYLYGTRIEATGEAVLVATPRVCDSRDFANFPDDYLPFVFLAPNQKTAKELIGRELAVPNEGDVMEFLIGHVSEASYDAPVSQLTFHRAEIEEIDRGDFNDLRRNGEPNVVPYVRESNRSNDYFRGGVFDDDDVRNRSRMECGGFIRTPISTDVAAVVDELRPESEPLYWVAPVETGAVSFRTSIRSPSETAAIDMGHWGWNVIPGRVHSEVGQGIRRVDGVGDLNSTNTPGRSYGLVPVIAGYGTETYPLVEQTPEVLEEYRLTASSEGPRYSPEYDTHLDTDDIDVNYHVIMVDGWDTGFVLCARDSGLRLLYEDRTGTRARGVYIDDNYLGDQNWGFFGDNTLIERNKYIFSYSHFHLNSEFTRMD